MKGKKLEQVELLFSSDCPSYVPVLELVRAVLAEERIALEVCMVPIDTVEEAQRQRFPGSPTIRLDGEDLEGPMAPPVGFTCRTYRGPDGTYSRLPDKEAIRRAVLVAAAGSERSE